MASILRRFCQCAVAIWSSPTRHWHTQWCIEDLWSPLFRLSAMLNFVERIKITKYQCCLHDICDERSLSRSGERTTELWITATVTNWAVAAPSYAVLPQSVSELTATKQLSRQLRQSKTSEQLESDVWECVHITEAKIHLRKVRRGRGWGSYRDPNIG